MNTGTHMKCDDCGHTWFVPAFDASGDDYNGDDLYECPKCGSESFGEDKDV